MTNYKSENYGIAEFDELDMEMISEAELEKGRPLYDIEIQILLGQYLPKRKKAI